MTRASGIDSGRPRHTLSSPCRCRGGPLRDERRGWEIADGSASPSDASWLTALLERPMPSTAIGRSEPPRSQPASVSKASVAVRPPPCGGCPLPRELAGRGRFPSPGSFFPEAVITHLFDGAILGEGGDSASARGGASRAVGISSKKQGRDAQDSRGSSKGSGVQTALWP